MKKYLKVLGHNARDAVTGYMGVVTSVSFDLFGCVQVWLTPAAGELGKQEDGRWFDFKRITPTDAGPVMAVPDFDGEEPGPAAKGAPHR